MNVLIIGSGGREHALAWKISHSPRVSRVFVAPGNAGTALEPSVYNVAIDPADFKGLIEFAKKSDIDFTVVGPEGALVDGIVDEFLRHGMRCFGPDSEAARLEGSKVFAKNFLIRHGIPTARFCSFTDQKAALKYLDDLIFPVVIKADGLAAGKGVIICTSHSEAASSIIEMLSGNLFGKAGHNIIIEEYLQGEEASFICIIDGRDFLVLASSQDHKAAYNGDLGPNTGGMGAYSPAPVIDRNMHDRIIEQVIQPTVKGLIADKISYRGFLYAGLMIENNQPRVLEFNCRLGDPEAQAVLMRLDSDLVELCMAALDGRLSREHVIWNQNSALGIIMASQGYPQSSPTGFEITGLDECFSENVKVFHSGTMLDRNKVRTSGGRVLCVTASAKNIKEAQRIAYRTAGAIQWQGSWHRDDIGYRAINRTAGPA